MSNTLLIKRSSTPGAVPGTGNLALGELAINTYDGKLYAKINDGSTSVLNLSKNQTIIASGNVTGTSVDNSSNSTITLTLSNTGVTAGTYGGSSGSSANVGVFQVDQYGRIVSASNVAISTSSLSNGNSNIGINANGNITVSVAGVANVAVFTANGVVVTGNVSSGNVLTNNLLYANGTPWDFQLPGGANTEIQFNLNGDFGASSAFTFNQATNALSVGGTASVSGTVTGGNLATAGTASAGGNITGANILTGGLVSATGNIVTGANAVVSGYATVTGNVTGGNLTTGGTANVNLLIVNTTASIVGNVTGGNVLTGGLISATANITGGNLLTAGAVSATGSVTGASLETGGGANVVGNVTGGNLLTGGLISATATITGGNLATAGTVSATSNIAGGNVLTGGLVSATGNIISQVGSFFIGNGSQLTGVTASSVSANALTGNTLSSNVIFSSLTSVGTLSSLSVSGNTTSGNLLTGGLVSATGNIIGGNVNTGTVQPVSGVLTLSTLGNSNIQIQPGGTGNIVLNATYINALADPIQNQDAATKIYVDNLVTTAISYHDAVVVATNTTLATATGGTVTYNNGTAGVGATLTTTGTFNLIDTGNVQTVGTRILVKNEANAAHNGIYTWSNATVIVRSSDADTYGPANAGKFSINDYFFVTGGNVNEGSAWIVDSPTGVITFGTSNIAFAQFSSSQVYEANTQAGLNLSGTTFSAKVDNTTTAFDGGGNIVVKASANLTTPNIGAATGTSLSVTGAVTGSTVSATGNITGGNVATAGLITATGNIVTGANLIASGYATVTGNVTGGNVLTGGLISATANITGGNIVTVGTGSIATLVVSTLANITATTNATSNITGALRVAGGVGVTGNVYADGMYVFGDSVLTVNSTIDGGTY